jgi:hypothetical protein
MTLPVPLSVARIYFITILEIIQVKMVLDITQMGWIQTACNNKNSYLCNKLGKVIFFRTRCGIFNRDEVEIKNASCTEKTLFLRIAHMIFSTGVWKIHKIWIFLIHY